jgi:hypothetical protein
VRFKYKRGHSLCSKNITICDVGAIRGKVYGKWEVYGKCIDALKTCTISRSRTKKNAKVSLICLPVYSEGRMSSFSVRTGRVWRQLKVPSGQIRSA